MMNCINILQQRKFKFYFGLECPFLNLIKGKLGKKGRKGYLLVALDDYQKNLDEKVIKIKFEIIYFCRVIHILYFYMTKKKRKIIYNREYSNYFFSFYD